MSLIEMNPLGGMSDRIIGPLRRRGQGIFIDDLATRRSGPSLVIDRESQRRKRGEKCRFLRD
jgi:hypothetical protein